jgi:uncharacterized protein (TIGR02147 family)
MKPGFSYRVFCRTAGINSPGLVSEILAGTRKLSSAYIRKFAVGLGLDEKESRYFAALVPFTHAGDGQAREDLYAEMLQAMPPRAQGLRRSQWDYFSKWYHVAVREALAICAVGENPGDIERLARRLDPPITPAQAQSALALLKDLDLIAKDTEGNWKARHDSLATPGDESQSLLFRAYRKAMLARAAEALDRAPAAAQNQSCVTLSVSEQGMRRILAQVEEFHKRILETVRMDSGEDRVMQLNLQFFPLTHLEDRHAA